MLVTNHVLSGAVVGRVVRNVPAAFGVAVLSHLVLDAVPHWGGKPLEEVMGVAVADGLTGLAGMAGAAFLDLDKPSSVFFGLSPFPQRVDAFHGRIQRESPRRMPQELLVGLTGALLVAALTRRARGRS